VPRTTAGCPKNAHKTRDFVARRHWLPCSGQSAGLCRPID
jgi:hypothetical protein